MFNTTKAPMAKYSNQVHEEVNQVYKTSNLSMFKHIEGNRIPNLQHIRRLADSIRVYGMKCNPILVNERMEVIDGQHRLLAAKDAGSFVYYIIISGYSLSEVHTLNLNQKNWSKSDYMDGYANKGIQSYIKLKAFVEKNDDFGFGNCLAMCSNISNATGNYTIAKKYNKDGVIGNKAEVFEDGTWVGKDFNLAQEWANKIRMIKSYYSGYNKTTFVGTMITLFNHPHFDMSEFMHKLRLQPTALVDCSNRDQYKTLIEDIYNYRSRNKVSFKY
jgi:hypothetical protein